MLHADAKSKIINNIGIISWQPRVARCMVLLEKRQQHTQVLEGMLNVLQLPKAHIIRIIVPALDLANVTHKLKIWQPQYILQLNMEYPEVACQKVFRTYSPDHLAANPRDKAAAYQQLLLLKDALHNDPA